MMLIGICLSLIIGFSPVYADKCRHLFLAFNAILSQRSYAPFNNETCWDQCYVAREDFALILNDRNHPQYEWCSPDTAGLCIADQGIVVQETCSCTIILQFPSILKDGEKDDHGNSCAVKDIQSRLSLPKRGKYTDFPVYWHPVVIQMKREGGLPLSVDHYEAQGDVGCRLTAIGHYRYIGEYCDWRGGCTRQKHNHKRYPCDHTRDPELNLIDTVPEQIYYRATKSMDFLQLDNNPEYIPVIPYL